MTAESSTGESRAARDRRRPGPRPGTPRAPRMKRAEREVQIVGIAEQIFGERGFQATTMEDIAEAAGITKPVIYDLFGSKEGLLAAAIARARTQLQEAMEEAWRGIDAEAPTFDYFRAGVAVFYAFMDEHASAWSVINQESATGASAQEHVEEFRATHARNIVAVLDEAGRAPEVPHIVLEGVIEGLIGAMERIAVWRTRKTDVSAEEATDLVMALTWHGLASALADRRS